MNTEYKEISIREQTAINLEECEDDETDKLIALKCGLGQNFDWIRASIESGDMELIEVSLKNIIQFLLENQINLGGISFDINHCEMLIQFLKDILLLNKSELDGIPVGYVFRILSILFIKYKEVKDMMNQDNFMEIIDLYMEKPFFAGKSNIFKLIGNLLMIEEGYYPLIDKYIHVDNLATKTREFLEFASEYDLESVSFCFSKISGVIDMSKVDYDEVFSICQYILVKNQAKSVYFSLLTLKNIMCDFDGNKAILEEYNELYFIDIFASHVVKHCSGEDIDSVGASILELLVQNNVNIHDNCLSDIIERLKEPTRIIKIHEDLAHLMCSIVGSIDLGEIDIINVCSDLKQIICTSNYKIVMISAQAYFIIINRTNNYSEFNIVNEISFILEYISIENEDIVGLALNSLGKLLSYSNDTGIFNDVIQFIDVDFLRETLNEISVSSSSSNISSALLISTYFPQ